MTRRLFATLAAVVVAALAFAPTPADSASWGSGVVTNSWTTVHGFDQRVVELRDLKTDWHCVRVSVKTTGQWFDAGISHCSGVAAEYTLLEGSTIQGIRIKKGWTGWYQTIE